MSDTSCMIQGCQGRVYAPAGTQSICREHFFRFLTWRRRRGPQMFVKCRRSPQRPYSLNRGSIDRVAAPMPFRAVSNAGHSGLLQEPDYSAH
jgi:hypothetical protein